MWKLKLTSKHAILNSWGTLLITVNRKKKVSKSKIKETPRHSILNLEVSHSLTYTTIKWPMNQIRKLQNNYAICMLCSCSTYIDHPSTWWCLTCSRPDPGHKKIQYMIYKSIKILIRYVLAVSKSLTRLSNHISPWSHLVIFTS